MWDFTWWTEHGEETAEKLRRLGMGFLAIFGLITQLLPLIAESIKSVQSIIGTTAGSGPVKKETVKTLVNSAISVTPPETIHSVPPEVLDKVLDKTIDGLVVAMKATGKLEK